MPALSRLLSRIALAGMAAWLVLLVLPLGSAAPAEEEAAHLVLLAPLVLVPLFLDAALPASFSARPSRLLTASGWALLPAALAAAGGFLVDAGPEAGALAVPWLVVTALLATWALRRAWGLWQADRLDASEALVTVGFASLLGGAVWLFLSRVGIAPGDGDLGVLLTAAHVHHAAFAAPVWAGLLGRALPEAARPAHAALGAGLVVGFGLVAVGVAVNPGPGGPALVETVGVVVLTLSATGVGALGMVMAPRLGDRSSALMVAVSGGALALAMGLALWVDVGPRLGVGVPDSVRMLAQNGWLSAVGFGLWGALGWRRLKPRPRIAEAARGG
ncbi:MAG: YndJ family transporter [Bacteroidota bacterium]